MSQKFCRVEIQKHFEISASNVSGMIYKGWKKANDKETCQKLETFFDPNIKKRESPRKEESNPPSLNRISESDFQFPKKNLRRGTAPERPEIRRECGLTGMERNIDEESQSG